MLKIEVYVPEEALERVRTAVEDYCIVDSDNYRHCMSWYKVTSVWMPVGNAKPYLGTLNQDFYADEYVLVFRCRMEDLDNVKKAIKDNHPYEDAVMDVYELR